MSTVLESITLQHCGTACMSQYLPLDHRIASIRQGIDVQHITSFESRVWLPSRTNQIKMFESKQSLLLVASDDEVRQESSGRQFENDPLPYDIR